MFELKFPIEPRNSIYHKYTGILGTLKFIDQEFTADIRSELSASGLSVVVHHRVKNFESLYTKILKAAAKADQNTSSITINDLIGIRVVCPFLEEVDSVSELINNIYEVTEHEIKGSEYPAQHFGYESVHFLVKIPGKILSEAPRQNIPAGDTVCEIQVRTQFCRKPGPR